MMKFDDRSSLISARRWTAATTAAMIVTATIIGALASASATGVLASSSLRVEEPLCNQSGSIVAISSNTILRLYNCSEIVSLSGQDDVVENVTIDVNGGTVAPSIVISPTIALRHVVVTIRHVQATRIAIPNNSPTLLRLMSSEVTNISVHIVDSVLNYTELSQTAAGTSSSSGNALVWISSQLSSLSTSMEAVTVVVTGGSIISLAAARTSAMFLITTRVRGGDGISITISENSFISMTTLISGSLVILQTLGQRGMTPLTSATNMRLVVQDSVMHMMFDCNSSLSNCAGSFQDAAMSVVTFEQSFAVQSHASIVITNSSVYLTGKFALAGGYSVSNAALRFLSSEIGSISNVSVIIMDCRNEEGGASLTSSPSTAGIVVAGSRGANVIMFDKIVNISGLYVSIARTDVLLTNALVQVHYLASNINIGLSARVRGIDDCYKSFRVRAERISAVTSWGAS